MGVFFKSLGAVVLGVFVSANANAGHFKRCERMLSRAERAQLGTTRILQNGEFASRRFPTLKEWPHVRNMLLKKSERANPLLSAELTAYTPGETLHLLKHATIQKWHSAFRSMRLPAWVKTVVFVPCAKTKPWSTAKRGLYKSYNRLRKLVQEGRLPGVYFVTISEPLGIVPEGMWGAFPQYDNPGLFRDTVQRSSMLTRDWVDSEFGEALEIPFDEEAYEKSIGVLGEVIADFMATNSDKTFVSFVEDLHGKSSHSDMLDRALEIVGEDLLPAERRYLRRPAPRVEPYRYMLARLRRKIVWRK